MSELDEPTGMAEHEFVVVWLLGDCFLPRELHFQTKGPDADVVVFPFEGLDSAVDGLVADALRRCGILGTYRTGRKRQLAAIVFRLLAVGWEAAASATQPNAEQLMTTLAFRQEGLGRVLGSLVLDPSSGQIMTRLASDSHSQITWLPFQPEEQEVVFQWSRIHSTPQGPTLARFFSEACQELNPTVSVVRLWALLEALGEQLPGTKLDHVRRVLTYAQQSDMDIDGLPLTQRAWDIRNGFMHHGRLAATDLATRVRSELKNRLLLVLFQVDWQPLPRNAPRIRPGGSR